MMAVLMRSLVSRRSGKEGAGRKGSGGWEGQGKGTTGLIDV